MFAVVDETVAGSKSPFQQAGVSTGPLIGYCPRRGRGDRRWFPAKTEAGEGITFVGAMAFVAGNSWPGQEHPSVYIEPLDSQYKQDPQKWLQRVRQLTQRLIGHPPPAALPPAVAAAMHAYVLNGYGAGIGINSFGGSLPMRALPDHDLAVPGTLASFLYSLVQGSQFGMVLESGTGLGGTALAIARGLSVAQNAQRKKKKWLYTLEAVREMWLWTSINLAHQRLPVFLLLREPMLSCAPMHTSTLPSTHAHARTHTQTHTHTHTHTHTCRYVFAVHIVSPAVSLVRGSYRSLPTGSRAACCRGAGVVCRCG